MLMFHANVFVIDEQQSSPRGGDKFSQRTGLCPWHKESWAMGFSPFVQC